MVEPLQVALKHLLRAGDEQLLYLAAIIMENCFGSLSRSNRRENGAHMGSLDLIPCQIRFSRRSSRRTISIRFANAWWMAIGRTYSLPAQRYCARLFILGLLEHLAPHPPHTKILISFAMYKDEYARYIISVGVVPLMSKVAKLADQVIGKRNHVNDSGGAAFHSVESEFGFGSGQSVLSSPGGISDLEITSPSSGMQASSDIRTCFKRPIVGDFEDVYGLNDAPDVVKEHSASDALSVELVTYLDCIYLFTENRQFFRDHVSDSVRDFFLLGLWNLIALPVAAPSEGERSIHAATLSRCVLLMREVTNGTSEGLAAIERHLRERYLLRELSTEECEKVFVHAINCCAGVWGNGIRKGGGRQLLVVRISFTLIL